MQFPTLLLGWVSHFCAEGWGWVMCFLSTIFPNAPAHPPPPLYFLTSPLSSGSGTTIAQIGKEGRQSLAITALVVQSFDSTITQIKIYSVDNATGFRNNYPLDLVISPADSAIQRLNNWTQPFNLQQQQDQSFLRVLTGPDTGLRNWTQLDPVQNWAVPCSHLHFCHTQF